MDYSKIGNRLKLARERKGLSYDQIFEITRIQPSILEGIEEGRAEVSPVFLRGFIKSYARSLGIIPEELFKEVKGEVFLEEGDKKKSSDGLLDEVSVKKIKGKKLIWMILVGVIVLSIIWILNASKRNQEQNLEKEEVRLDKPIGLDKPIEPITTKAHKSDVSKSDVLEKDLVLPTPLEQIKKSMFKEEVVIQSSTPLKIYFKTDQHATVTKNLKALVWFTIKAKKSIYLRFDEKRGDIQFFYNGEQVLVEDTFFEKVFRSE